MTGAEAPMPPRVPERVLLIQLQQLGDVLLTSALLQDLRAALPDSRIDFLTRPKPALLLQGNPLPSEIVVYDPGRALRMPWRIRARRYDWIVDAQSSPRSAQVVLASGARRKVGWGISGPWRFAYTDRVFRDRAPAGYVVRERQRLLEALGVPVTPRLPVIHLDSREREQGRQDARALGAPTGAPLVGLVVSARVPAETWPVERFADLAERLAAEGTAVVALGTQGDDENVSRLTRLAGATLRADAPELRRFLGLLSALDLLVCGNTGPAHMAMALGVPTVTLYGPTYARHWNPGLPTSAAVSSPRKGCAACARNRRRNAAGHTCMLEIEVGAVHASVRELLHATATRNR